jgi:long-chain acyl-CoA synthetase
MTRYASIIPAPARENPGGTALDDLSRQRTWEALADRCTRIAQLLRHGLGLGADDHAAVLMGNRIEFVELVLGAILAGVWITPINRHLGPEEIAYVIEDSGAKALFCDPEHEALARRSPAPRVLAAGPELDAAVASASATPMPLDGPAGGTMIYTSGTTGRPKGVKRARASSLGAALDGMGASGRRLGLDGDGAHLVTGPLYHAAPLLFALYDQRNGAPIVIMPAWDDVGALRLIGEREIRHTHMVPTMFVRLLRLPAPARERFDPGSLRLVLHGAAPIAPHVKRQIIDWWGPVLVEYWGATEGGVCTLVDSTDWLAHPGTVGRAIPTFEVFAVDAAGTRLPAGETGVLYCRHASQADVFEYHGAPEKTAACHLAPGVFTTGDVGRVDADGFVYLSDRQAHTIISGGVNIYPAEIEQVLQRHPAVADVGVFGVPDDEWGEAVKAAIELADGWRPSPQLTAEILAFGRQHLAGYKIPGSIDFVTRLPRDSTGKLRVRELRDPYWKGRARSI